MDKDPQAMSDAELRDQLLAFGVTVGPVMGTTRVVYEKKLAKLIKESKTSKSKPAPAAASPPKRPASKSPARTPAAPKPTPAASKPTPAAKTASTSVASSRKKVPLKSESEEDESDIEEENPPPKKPQHFPVTSTPDSSPTSSTKKSTSSRLAELTARNLRDEYEEALSSVRSRSTRSNMAVGDTSFGTTPPRRPGSSKITSSPGRSTKTTSSVTNYNSPSTYPSSRAERVSLSSVPRMKYDTEEDTDGEDGGRESSRIVYNSEITGPEKRGFMRKSLDKLLGYDFKAGKEPGTSYDLRTGLTRTKVDRDPRTGRVRVQQQSVGRDVPSILLIILIVFFLLLAIAYIVAARREAVIATAEAARSAFYETIMFVYMYAILPTGLVIGLTLLVLAIYFGHKKWSEAKETEEARFYELIDNILETVRESTTDYIAVPHVRDIMFPPAKRTGAEMARWNRAVAFINDSESRVSTELRLINGQECPVWKWLPPTKAGWQGNAFGSPAVVKSPISANVPKEGLTRCLKLREMFGMNENVNESAIKSSLREKLFPIEPLHVNVFTNAPDGIVFMMFKSRDEAHKAFTILHGTWFNGRLVSVKYMREERYVERFPQTAEF